MDARSAILAAAPLQLEPVEVPVPEWGIPTAYVRTIDGLERDKFEEDWQEAQAEDPAISFRGYVVAWFLCNKDGVPLSSDAKDVAVMYRAIVRKHSKATARLFFQASLANGLTKSDLDRLEGKCEAETPADGSAGNGESL